MACDIIKSRKKAGFHPHSLGNTFLKKPQIDVLQIIDELLMYYKLYIYIYNIYNLMFESRFSQKKAPSQMFDSVLNTPPYYHVYRKR